MMPKKQTKRPLIVVAETGTGSRLNLEADVFTKLDSDEAYLLKRYPSIDNSAWRFSVNCDQNQALEQFAVEILDCIRALREVLQDSSTPAWKAAALGIKYQDRLMQYRQPQDERTRGRINSDKRESAPKPDDALTMQVLRHLRKQGKSWKQVLRALESAASNQTAIDGIGIQQEKNRFFFSNENSEENFTVSTLQRKKFSKVR